MRMLVRNRKLESFDGERNGVWPPLSSARKISWAGTFSCLRRKTEQMFGIFMLRSAGCVGVQFGSLDLTRRRFRACSSIQEDWTELQRSIRYPLGIAYYVNPRNCSLKVSIRTCDSSWIPSWTKRKTWPTKEPAVRKLVRGSNVVGAIARPASAIIL